MFNAKIEKEDNRFYLSVTQNGSQWSAISFRSLGDMQAAANALLEYLDKVKEGMEKGKSADGL